MRQILLYFTKVEKINVRTCLSTEYKNREDKQEYMEKQKKWRTKNILHYRVESAKHKAKRYGLVFELNDKIVK